MTDPVTPPTGSSKVPVSDLEDTLSGGRYAKDKEDHFILKYQVWDQEQRALDKGAERTEQAKEKDFSRERRRDTLWAFLGSACLIALFGLLVFASSQNQEDRKSGIAAALTALSAVGGLAAGMGFR